MFALRVAFRYLTANRVQSGLLIGGVALSVIVFVFMTALIRGLALFLTVQTTGQIAHVEMEPPRRIAEVMGPDARFAAQPISTFQRQQIRNWQLMVDQAEQLDHVVAVVPEVNGNGFLVRGTAVAPIALQGIDPSQIDAIIPLSKSIIDGSADLSTGGLLIGAELAEDLGLRAGVPVILRSDRGIERLIPVTGIFRIGLSNVDRRVAYLSIAVARPLLALPNGVTSVSIKLDDPALAPLIAEQLKRQLPLKVTAWQEKNRNLETALESQGRTGNFIQAFALIAIMISIASALLLTSVRRRGEIGIMRSFGISRGFVASVFVFQGVIIGLAGSLIGSALGYRLCLFLSEGITGPDGGPLLPIAPAEGGYVLVIVLTVVGSAISAILPAQAAARLDPVEAIQQ
ncbi:ABC transporter permease [Sphingorhabdus sp. IMCC26285]|uniref:ABC transporter permease n=1 Tax=Sphingorhabdus profundilacus TaxID=2509718 RepID=A0A6I4LST0_9SPHN|nr:ABC transporter permease [Sphingorhabdus profundilacus]